MEETEIGVILDEVRQFRIEVNRQLGELHDRISELSQQLEHHRETGNGARALQLLPKTAWFATTGLAAAVATAIASTIAAIIKLVFLG